MRNRNIISRPTPLRSPGASRPNREAHLTRRVSVLPGLLVVALLLLSPPRAWSADAPPTPPELVLDRATARELFAGRQAKLLIYNSVTKQAEGCTAWLVDLQAETWRPEPVVTDAFGGKALLSPDGTRIAFGRKGGELWVCRAAAGGPDATLIAGITKEQGRAFDPDWWVHPKTGDEYLIWVDTPWNNETDLAGRTLMRKLKRGTCEPDGPTLVLLPNLAFRGGRSPCGRFIGTAQPGTAVARIGATVVENAVPSILWSTIRHCNGRMSQDPVAPSLFLFEDHLHDRILSWQDGRLLEPIRIPKPYDEIQGLEFSNGGAFIACVLVQGLKDGSGGQCEGFLYQRATGRWIPVTRRNSVHKPWYADRLQLWIEPDGAAKPAVTAATAESEAAPDPKGATEPPGLVWSWTDRRGVRLLDGRGNRANATFLLPRSRGLAVPTGMCGMRLAGGGFIEANRHLDDMLRQGSELGLEAVVRVPSGQAGGGPLISLASGPAPAGNWWVTVGAQGELGFRPSAGAAEAPLGRLPLDRPAHLVLSWSGNAVTACIDGTIAGIVRGEPLSFQPARWTAHPLVFGNPGRDDTGLRAEISNVSLFNRALPIAEVRSRAEAWRRDAPPAAPLRIEARLAVKPRMVPPKETAYERAYLVYDYDVLKVVTGALAEPRIRVFRWAQLDRRRLASQLDAVGQTVVLDLEPLAAHPEFESETVFDDDPVSELPIHVAIEAPAWAGGKP